MKKLLYTAALAILAAMVLSCEKEPSTGEERSSVNNELTPEQEFWAVVGQLVSMDDMTSDYKGKTFTPIIGTETEPGIRVVGVNSLQAAVERYNSLVGASIDTNTVSHTYTSTEVGSLSWSKSADNRSWATVDVSIPSVPTLQRIVYRSGAQGDVNGSVGKGYRAYYRFGDVVKRVRAEDNATEYWVCVRPAFDPEDKGKSHWITVSPLPEKNIWPYYDTHQPYISSTDLEYGLPYNLRDDLEWPQDLAEMLYAICNPVQWFANITQYSSENMFGSPKGLPIFNDFHSSKKGYHNQYFWKNVQKAWTDKQLFQTVFGRSIDGDPINLAWFQRRVEPGNEGLNFLYNGYSWWVKTSNTAQLYQVNFKSETGKDGVKLNMHSKTPTKPSHQVVNKKNKLDTSTNFAFDVKKECTLEKPYVQKPAFFGDNAPRWIIRYAEGQELAQDGKEDPSFALRGVETVYRYYDVYEQGTYDNDPPEETSEGGTGYIGKAHYKWGDVYKDETGAVWHVFNPAGVSPEPEGSRFNERSPYSELISFTSVGMDVFPGGSTVSNLPTLDQAIRVYMWLQLASNNTQPCINEQQCIDHPIFGLYHLNVYEHANLDIRRLMLYVTSQNKKERSDNLLCSIAYSGHAGGKQALVRCIENTENEQNQPQYYFWTKYPANPSKTEENVKNFSDVTIALQDIADQTMVDKYAEDAYARLAYSSIYGLGNNLNEERPIRSTTDSKATNVQNYWYNKLLWDDFQFRKDMWNEPVLFFRYTRVRDNGDNNYSKTTTDGHTLTLVSAREWTTDTMPNAEENYTNWDGFSRMIWISNDDMYLNGQKYELLTWDKIKDAN